MEDQESGMEDGGSGIGVPGIGDPRIEDQGSEDQGPGIEDLGSGQCRHSSPWSEP